MLIVPLALAPAPSEIVRSLFSDGLPTSWNDSLTNELISVSGTYRNPAGQAWIAG